MYFKVQNQILSNPVTTKVSNFYLNVHNLVVKKYHLIKKANNREKMII